ncbi:MAG: hypothetical protein IJB72_00685 [Clostridia bacterium]|nr:hypothetical protein [Clostridia bacterium]
MNNTISQLYRGELEPKNILGNGNVELRRMEILIRNNLERLKENLNENEKEVLEKYSGLVDEYIFLMSEQAFCDGFCLGMRISAEATGGV